MTLDTRTLEPMESLVNSARKASLYHAPSNSLTSALLHIEETRKGVLS